MASNLGLTASIFGQEVTWSSYLLDLFAQCEWEMGYNKGDVMGASTPEGRVKARLNKRLRELNLVWKFMPVPSGYGMQSLDYLLCVAGYFVAIETKAPGKNPTPRQEQTIAAIKAAGGIAFVVDDDESLDACIGALCVLLRVPAQRAA